MNGLKETIRADFLCLLSGFMAVETAASGARRMSCEKVLKSWKRGQVMRVSYLGALISNDSVWNRIGTDENNETALRRCTGAAR
ncbi:MAG: hypothetical protein OXE76_04665 [Alphaproteobacteria bacterium]|nr:hypothetical protein [Alphaproteobacteria bacterium]